MGMFFFGVYHHVRLGVHGGNVCLIFMMMASGCMHTHCMLITFLMERGACMGTLSCHHHVSRTSTGQEVHAHSFSQYAFCIMAAASRC
jgi:hypothetical protein